MCIALVLSFYLSTPSWISSFLHTTSSLSGISYISVSLEYVTRELKFTLGFLLPYFIHIYFPIFGFVHMMDGILLLLIQNLYVTS